MKTTICLSKAFLSKYIKILFIPLVIFTVSCKKTDSSFNESTITSELSTKVSGWLTIQKKELTPVKNKVINSLLENLDMSGASAETFNKEEQLIIVPLKSGFVSNNNKGKDPINVLQLIEGKDHKIRSGQIIQFIPAQPGKYSHIPTGTFHNLYNSKKLDVDGTFTYLSIGDIFSYEFEFKKGELYAEKIMKHEAATAPGNTQRDGEYCTHWWILTTYIFADGHTEYDVTDLGVTCSTCAPNQLCDHLDDGTGTGGGEETINEVSRDVEWQVTAASNGSWKIISYENIRGIRNPTDNTKNYFTNITHISSTNFNYQPAPPPNPLTTWLQISINVYLFGSTNHNAHSDITGKITFWTGENLPANGSHSWNSIIDL